MTFIGLHLDILFTCYFMKIDGYFDMLRNIIYLALLVLLTQIY